MASPIGEIVVRSAGSNAKLNLKTEKSDAEKAVESKIMKLEKVENFFGCVAGSGSDFFPIYRKNRNKELERLEQMDKDWDAKNDAEAFQARREAKAAQDDEAANKKASKRQRKKENAERNKKLRKE